MSYRRTITMLCWIASVLVVYASIILLFQIENMPIATRAEHVVVALVAAAVMGCVAGIIRMLRGK